MSSNLFKERNYALPMGGILNAMKLNILQNDDAALENVLKLGQARFCICPCIDRQFPLVFQSITEIVINCGRANFVSGY